MKRLLYLFPILFFSISSSFADDIIVLEHDDEIEIVISEDYSNPSLSFGEALDNTLSWDSLDDAFQFSSDVDFGGNEIIDFRLENLDTAPTCDTASKGRGYHNTTTQYSYICTGNSWVIIDNDSTSTPVVLPYVYNLSPQAFPLNSTETITITGSNFSPSTLFTFGEGVAVQSITIIDGETAVAEIITGDTAMSVDVVASQVGESWVGNTLSFNIYGELDSQSIMDNFSENIASVGTWIPNVYPIIWDNGITGNRVIDGGNDMYDNGNYLNTDGQTQIQYTGGSLITNEVAWGVGGEYFTRIQDDIFIMTANPGDGVTTFFVTGNLGADGNGSMDTVDLNYSGYNAFVKRVYGAGSDPSINHMIIASDEATLIHDFSTNTNNDFDEVSGIETLADAADEKLYYILFATEAGGYVDDVTMGYILEYIVDNILR